jgi:putative hydrolase of HD superfamily
MNSDRLRQQIQFILEIDKLKSVLRRSYLLNPERRENSAEHSWHVAVMAVLLAEYAAEPVDLPRLLKMLLIHDMVEIDAGDTFAYDPVGARDQAERERRAAERLFKLLPPDQAGELRGLWDEFEAHATPEAKFARALDHLMPLLHNYYTQGKSWQEHGVSSAQVLSYNADIEDGSARLWELAQSLIADAVARGYLVP